MAIYGMRFRPLGQTSYYSSQEPLAAGDQALLMAEHGQALATVVSGPLESLPGSSEADLPAIIRPASPEDLDIHAKNLAVAQQARKFCLAKIAERKLEMKLVDVEVFFDRSKIIFYFTAPTRIDFRELVKDLVREYRARIELRQIGVRHETQMLGAIGNCGQVCCCHAHLRKFAPVTIRMAKEQNLFLNPAKISGICGRLLCCLSYEQENYEQFRRESPRPGKKYQTASGLMKVTGVNMFKNSVTFVDDKDKEQELSMDEWKELKPWRPGTDLQTRDQSAGRDNPC